MAASSSARSPAVRAMGPSTANGSHGAATGQCGTSPGVGLQAENAAPGRGVAKRAAEVAAVGDRQHPAGQRDGAATARAARRARRVPGVARGAEDRVERVRSRAPLGRVRLAHEDRARLAQPLRPAASRWPARARDTTATRTSCARRPCPADPCARSAGRAAAGARHLGRAGDRPRPQPPVLARAFASRSR